MSCPCTNSSATGKRGGVHYSPDDRSGRRRILLLPGHPPRPIAERLAALVAPVFSALTIPKPQNFSGVPPASCPANPSSSVSQQCSVSRPWAFSPKMNFLFTVSRPRRFPRGIHCSGKGQDEEAVTSLLAAVRELGTVRSVCRAQNGRSMKCSRGPDFGKLDKSGCINVLPMRRFACKRDQAIGIF